MNKKTLSIAILALAAAPLTTQAATGPEAAVNACVKAFVSTYLPGHPVRPMKSVIPQNPLPLALWQRKHTVDLSARGAESGKILAEARCIADNNGIVIVLDSPPANALPANFVATLITK